MEDRYGDRLPSSTTGGSSRTTADSGGTTTTSTTESFNKLNTTEEALAAINKLIASGGMTPEIAAQQAQRQQQIALVNQLLGQVSTGQAMTDAEAAMALSLQQALEKNMPAISKAIEGAGTSASSAQASLSTRMARDASLAAGALGAEQAKAYAGQRTGLASILEGLTRGDAAATNTLIAALNASQGAVQSGSSTTEQSSITTTPAATSTTTSQPSVNGSTEANSASWTGAGAKPSALDPNTYYSSLGASGSGQSLLDYLTAN